MCFSNFLFLLLTSQIIFQGRVNMRETEHYTAFETSQLLTSRINPSTILQTSQGFNFRCISYHAWLEKTFRFALFSLLENALTPWHDLIISYPMNLPNEFAQNHSSPHKGFFRKKLPLLILQGVWVTMVIVTKVVWLSTKVKNIYFFHYIYELTSSTYPKEPPSVCLLPKTFIKFYV